MLMTRIGLATIVLGLLLGGAQLAHAQPARSIEQIFAGSLTDVPQQPLSLTGSIYVPTYSSVSMSQGKVRADFSVTVTVHNTSQDTPLVLTRIAYFDTAGKLVESYLPKPIALKPFAAIEIYISQNDIRGGTGANFIIDWAATGAIAEPLAEALMVGGIGAGHYAFVSQGRPIRIVGAN